MNENEKYIDGLNRAFCEFKAENNKGRGADLGVLARINGELDGYEDAAKRHRRETLSAQLTRERAAMDSTLSTEAREYKHTFWTWTRFGHPDGRGDPLRTYDAEVKWSEARRRTGLDLEAKALTVSDDTSGGFLAPPDYVAELIKAIVLISPMRELCRVRQTVNRSVQQPKRTGTAAAVWVSESGTRTESQNPTYGGTEIPTHELSAEVYVSFADAEDSAFDLETELRDEFSEQFGFSEGAAVVSGNGIGKPFGFLDAGQGIATTNSGTSGSIASASGAKGDALINLAHAVKTPYATNATWVLNRATLGSVRKLADTQGRYLWEPSLAVDSPSRIIGYPYLEVPDMPSESANSLSVGFGDWRRAYTIADRITLALTRDPYSRASAGQIKFLARRRVGGQVVLAEAIKLLKCI